MAGEFPPPGLKTYTPKAVLDQVQALVDSPDFFGVVLFEVGREDLSEASSIMTAQFGKSVPAPIRQELVAKSALMSMPTPEVVRQLTARPDFAGLVVTPPDASGQMAVAGRQGWRRDPRAAKELLRAALNALEKRS